MMVCKGSMRIGTGCGRCTKCVDEKRSLEKEKTMKSQRLMKITGDIRALPYRDLIELVRVLGRKMGSEELDYNLAEAMLNTCDEINPPRNGDYDTDD